MLPGEGGSARSDGVREGRKGTRNLVLRRDAAAMHAGTSLSPDREKWEARTSESGVSENLSEETWQPHCAEHKVTSQEE